MIRLRALVAEDAQRTFEFRTDPKNKEMFLGNIFPNSLSLEKKWIEGTADLEPRTVTFGIESGKEGLVGFLQLKNIDYVHRHSEFSILIGSAFQGRSYGMVATREALSYALGTLNLRKVYLYVLANNIPALKLYKKIGFREAGVMKQHVYRNRSYQDLLIMEYFRE